MAVPDSLSQESGLCKAFAFDNYDENCKILSGTGTIHDTVRIHYQNLLYVTTGDTEKFSLLDGKRKRSLCLCVLLKWGRVVFLGNLY